MSSKASRIEEVEEWRVVPSLPRYEASNLGRIRLIRTGRFKSKSVLKDGYGFSKFSAGNYRHRVLRWVTVIAETWMPPRPTPAHQIDHVNGIKTDDRVSNFEWVSQSLNIQRSYDRGGRIMRTGPRLTKKQRARIRELWTTGKHSQVAIGRMVKCHNSTVSKLLSGRTRGVQDYRFGMDDYREWVRLHDQQGLRYHEIAARFGTDAHYVGDQCRRVRLGWSCSRPDKALRRAAARAAARLARAAS